MSVRDSVNRRITERFIKDNPVDVILTRRYKVPTASGGWQLGTPVLILPQRFTLIVNGPESPEITTDDGKVVVPTHTLVGTVEADIERNDTFVVEDKVYFVLQVSESRRDWAKRAAVAERGDGQS